MRQRRFFLEVQPKYLVCAPSTMAPTFLRLPIRPRTYLSFMNLERECGAPRRQGGGWRGLCVGVSGSCLRSFLLVTPNYDNVNTIMWRRYSEVCVLAQTTYYVSHERSTKEHGVNIPKQRGRNKHVRFSRMWRRFAAFSLFFPKISTRKKRNLPFSSAI